MKVFPFAGYKERIKSLPTYEAWTKAAALTELDELKYSFIYVNWMDRTEESFVKAENTNLRGSSSVRLTCLFWLNLAHLLNERQTVLLVWSKSS